MDNKLGISDEAFVRALYKTMYDKDNPDLEGLNWWLNDLKNGQTFEQVAHSFLGHPQWQTDHSVFPDTISGYIARNNEIISMAYENSFDAPVPEMVLNRTNILMFNAVPTEAIMTMFAQASVIGQGVEHPFWWTV
jgi:hypothetical protein